MSGKRSLSLEEVGFYSLATSLVTHIASDIQRTNRERSAALRGETPPPPGFWEEFSTIVSKASLGVGVGALSLAAISSLLTAINEALADEEPVYGRKKRIFLSHSWKEHHADLLDRFYWRMDNYEYDFYDHSVSVHDPMPIPGKPGSLQYNENLYYALRDKISKVSAVLVLWDSSVKITPAIQMEIDLAHDLNKKLIVLKRHGDYFSPAMWRRYRPDEIVTQIPKVIDILHQDDEAY